MGFNQSYLIALAITVVILFFISPGFAVVFVLALIGGGYYFMRMSAQLKESEERWKFALEGSGDGVWDWNVPEDMVIYSKRYKEMYGFSDSDVAANIPEWQERIHTDDREHVKKDVLACLDGKTPNYVNEHRVICKNGQTKWVLARGMVVTRDNQGKALRMIGTHTDITERKLMEDKIRQMAQYDALTGLPNRSLLHDRLHLAMAFARRDEKGLALMFIDLDGFKPVNDKYGHNIGDTLLKDVAQRMVNCVRASDSVARIGGDEFVILLSDIQTAEDVEIVAEKIMEAITMPFNVLKRDLRISASIGIAMYPQHGNDEKLLLINADVAMYHVKQNGGHGCAFYDPEMQALAS